MNTLNIVMTLTSFIGTVSTIFFAYLAFRRSEKEEEKKEVQIETTMISDIGYIKEGIKRVEKNISRLEEKYSDMNSRIIKVEEGLKSVKKIIDERKKKED